MKITKIEIENLNSLKGYWCIDLTHPDYKKNHDLFVICGETGSGKTTILDAITLALYGRTPRQDSFGDSNELMTRHTAKCMARVTYECKKGVFESEFSQSRARDNVNGNLQTARGTIKNLTTGETFPNLALKTMNSKTSEIVQLDYEQFCRSILLAQGQFAEFLEGEPKDRAAILAKLNGTEKYKIFAQNIWIRSKERIDKYTAAKKELADFKTLSVEEIGKLKDEIDFLQKKADKNVILVEEINQLLNWKEKLDTAKQNFDSAKRTRADFEEKLNAFEGEKYRLEHAEKAKICESDYKRLLDLRSAQKKDEEQKLKTEEDLKIKEEKFNSSENTVKKCNNEFLQLSEKASENEKLWKEVRKIDSQLENAEKNLTEKQKRKEDSEKKYEESVKKSEILEKELKKLDEECIWLTEYLTDNEKNKNLSEICSVLEVKKANLSKLLKTLSEDEKLFSDNGEKLSQAENELESVREEITKIENALGELIKNDYLLVAKLLRLQLQEGKSCPVCGSVEHPFCKNEENAPDSAEKNPETAKLSKNISELSERLEFLERRENDLTMNIDGFTKEKVRLSEEIHKFEGEIAASLGEINEKIAAWNIKISRKTYENDFSMMQKTFVALQNEYELKSAELKEKNESALKKRTEQEQIDLAALKTVFDAEKSAFDEAKTEFDTLCEKRKTLFSDKNVDIEEESFKNQLSEKENAFEKSKSEMNEAKMQKSNCEKALEMINTSLNERSEKLSALENAFSDALKKNDFADEDVFKSCLLDADEIAELQAKQNNLIEENAETNKQVAVCKAEFEKISAENRTSETAETLLEQKKNFSAENSASDRKIGELNRVLSENEKKQTEKAQKVEELSKLEEENDLWMNIRSMIGNKDGGTFETFVEALEFKNLLVRANRYVSKISGKYTLVQKEGEVDFLIHDENYPDPKDDRPVSNLSGGEKFIISLSLALGIAELASSHVMIDSLFLDEGFGTLSGEPLTEAINALKSLQTSGKMLGIITHIDGVINEFDQKIKAVKKSGGISELEGSGITHR